MLLPLYYVSVTIVVTIVVHACTFWITINALHALREIMRNLVCEIKEDQTIVMVWYLKLVFVTESNNDDTCSALSREILYLKLKSISNLLEVKNMTLGEKIKEARKQCGLTQEQLAEKMTLSRSAIAKWESDKGLPDVDNLKALAQLLNVSVDYLLDDGETVAEHVIREAYNLSDYGKGSKKKKKDRLVLEKFPNATIHPLIGNLKLTKAEKVMDNMIGFLTDAPFGIPSVINSLKNTDKEFYLVEKENRQFFVIVTDEFIETRQLAKHITDKKFEIGNWKFIKCSYEVK
jgi:transcriptional regulator with XRE-family HTH domain